MNNYNCTDVAILILRVGLAFMMLTHGIGKAGLLFSGDEIKFIDPIGLGATVSLILAVFAEVICSFLILIGLKLRFSVTPLIVTMLIAIFMVHLSDPWSSKELAVMYLLGYVVLFLSGAGKFSLDYLFTKK